MNQTENSMYKSQRNYGIDLLRLVAAFYVIVLHTLNRGGIYYSTVPDSSQEFLCKFLLITAMCAVNIFGIISGYVGYREPLKRISYSSYLPLWLTVVFYCVLITGFYMCFFPGSVNHRDLIESFFPLTKNLLWYFSAYTLVYFFSPFLNRMLYHSSIKELKHLLILICCIIALIEYTGNSFDMNEGYSAIWLLLLYLVGGIMKKTGIGNRLPAYTAALAILIIEVCFYYFVRNRTSISFFIFHFNLDICNSYIMPVYLATAILHVILFSKLRIGMFIKKAIQFSAPAAFSVYIINTNPAFWDNFMKNRFIHWAASSPVGILIRIILFSITFVFAVVIIDFFRQKLFHLLDVQRWPQMISRCIPREKQSKL